jgi:exodeoxyribonuclease VII large subunit
LTVSRAESRVTTLLHRLEQRLDDATQCLDVALTAQLRMRQNRIAELAAAVLRIDPRQRLAHARVHLADFRGRLDRCLERLLQSSAASLNALDARLHSLSPLAVLDRGYALVLSAEGALVRSTTQIAAGDHVTTRLANGSFFSRVESITATAPQTASNTATPAPNSRKRGKKSTL